MKLFLSKIKKYFLNNYLIIAGFILFSFFFWSRFLGARTSKVLPLNLSILNFFIILYICCIFTYILFSLIFSKKKNKLVEEFLDWIFTPIKELEKFMRHLVIKIMRPKKVLKIFWPILKFIIIETKIFYTLLWIFPRLLLLIALFIDVFVFHQFYYKYQVIIFGLLLLFNRCFKYTLKNIKEDKMALLMPYIKTVTTRYVYGIHPSEWPENYDPDDEDNDEIIPTMSLPLDIFIKYKTEYEVYKNIVINDASISTSLILSKEMWEKYIDKNFVVYFSLSHIPKDYKNKFGDKVPENYYVAEDLVRKKKKEYVIFYIEKIMQISLLIEYLNKTSNFDQEIKNMKILIYLNYLLCWLYVLIISIPSLDIENFFIILEQTYKLIEDPFSLFYITNEI